MNHEHNQMNQPLGPLIHDWRPPPYPEHVIMEGRFCRLEPLDTHHAESLYSANAEDAEQRNWTYLPYGPFSTLADFRTWIEQFCRGNDPLFYAIIDRAKETAVGVASYLRINPNSGSIEVGHLNYSPQLQRTPAATEAMYLMMKHAFELGYRRYEWKCNALNSPSRIAAQRLGFSFEGIFRQAAIIKGRNRDTAWYAALDREWPALKKTFQQWLSPLNFDEHGKQKVSLSALTAPLLNQRIVDMN